MSNLWYKKLGYFENPFSIKPAAFTSEIIGYNLHDIFKLIDTKNMLYVMGPFGTGKTTILKNLIARYGGKKKVVYFSCGLERKMNVKELLIGSQPFFGKIMGSVPKDTIFLVDEAQDIESSDAKDLLSYFKSNSIKSIVYVGTKISNAKFPKESQKLIELNTINLGKLGANEAITLIGKRLGSFDYLSQEVIRELYGRADHNMRALLELCEDVCKFCQEKGVKKITVKELLKIDHLPKKKKVQKKKKKATREQVDLAIEEAVMETESETPVVEMLSPIASNEPLPKEKKH